MPIVVRKMLTARKVLLGVLIFAPTSLLLADRFRMSRAFEARKEEAFEDSLKRQSAVVRRNRAILVENFIRVTKKESISALDGYFFFVTSDELLDIWEHEQEIDEAHYERATVSAKRMLEALDCRQVDDYFQFAERTITEYLARKGEPQEVNEDFLAGSMGLSTIDDLKKFRDFLTRACEDTVARAEDVESDFDARVQNAPGGEYRLF